MAHSPLPELNLVLHFLREGQGVGQAELGRLAGVSPNLLNDYEKGRKTLHRDRLEHLISFLGLPPEAIDATLASLHANRAASRVSGERGDPRVAAHRHVEAVAAQASVLVTDFVREVMSLLTREGEGIWERQRAELLWARLQRRSEEERIALVEDTQKFRSWALVERVAAASIDAAPDSAAKAVELATLARRIAELCPGEEERRLRLRGYAEYHVANSLRVANDLAGADASLATAGRLWEAGAPGDPGLNEAVVLGLEANIHREHGRFPEALRRIGQALEADRGDLRGRLLLTQAKIFEALGDIERSSDVLGNAIPLIDAEQEPRVLLGAWFQLLVNLCLGDRAAEAEPGLQPVRALAERLGQELDLVRVVWLEGKVQAGLGRSGEAEAAFEQTRRHFYARELDFDYSLVSLDRALLLLEQGRTAEVRALAEEMSQIFRRKKVTRESLAALRVYCDAARRDAATTELTRQVVRFLHRAQHDPRLRFEAGEEAGRH